MRLLRERRPVPVILLSAKGSTADKARGLDLGADDYLAKPFQPDELAARVRAILRRTLGRAAGRRRGRVRRRRDRPRAAPGHPRRRARPPLADRVAAAEPPRGERRPGRAPRRAADQGLGPGVPRGPRVPAGLGLARPAQARARRPASPAASARSRASATCSTCGPPPHPDPPDPPPGLPGAGSARYPLAMLRYRAGRRAHRRRRPERLRRSRRQPAASRGGTDVDPGHQPRGVAGRRATAALVVYTQDWHPGAHAALRQGRRDLARPLHRGHVGRGLPPGPRGAGRAPPIVHKGANGEDGYSGVHDARPDHRRDRSRPSSTRSCARRADRRRSSSRASRPTTA